MLYLLLFEYPKYSYTLYSQTQFCCILKLQSSCWGLIYHWQINTELSNADSAT